MRLSERLSYSINIVKRLAVGGWQLAIPLFAICCLLFTAFPVQYSYAQQETTIALDAKRSSAPAPQQKQTQENTSPKTEEVKSPKELKKEIKMLYSEAEKNRKKKRFLYAVQKYKEILMKDPSHKKAKARLSSIYSDTKVKIEDRIFTRSEDAYYAQSIIFFTNNDLTGALNEWGKYLAIEPQSEEVGDFYKTVKQQLTDEYNREKQEELEAKIKKLLEDGIDYFNAMKYREAAERFRTILKLSPGHPQADYYLDQINSIIAAENRKNVRIERVIVEKPAAKIDYEKATEFYNQGLQEYAAGHLREAVELWKKCLKYNSTHDKAKSNIMKAQAILEGK